MKILTNDGTYTLYSERFDETYHSISGALEESIEKFLKPCKVKKGHKVLDICFGLGYNASAALEKGARVVSLEKDRNILKLLQEFDLNLKSYELVKKNNHPNLRIVFGDAIKTIKNLRIKFDAVFLDPFSPKKNPELWTLDFLKDVKKRMKPNAILTTYSCARVVRDNLKDSGFLVKDGPIVGRTSPSTIAINKIIK